jgi:Zn-dependent peptidase ImmA (M78 family)/transcriptional regulator with XRE-family HTH domain
MDIDILRTLDPRELGRRLQEARKARGQTQQDAAVHINVARTTITAIEKGERRILPSELARLAVFYGRSVGEFLRQSPPMAPFTVQLRAVLAPGMEMEKEVSPGMDEFERLCLDYLELERICSAPLVGKYPEQYRTEGVPPESAGEDVASAERNRLGLGDGPLLNLREVMESDVGFRVFNMDLPSRIAEMFAYTDELGGCLAVNRKHPEERQRMSMAHGYAHFLANRYRPEVAFLGRYQRVPEQERFADSFARSFLMPEAGLRRRFNELKRSRQGHFTPSDLCTLAHFYFVSVEALTLRLEELRLLPGGAWDRLQQTGFKVQEAKGILHLRQYQESNQLLPLRYRYLAAEAFERAEITEGQLARFLRVDRLEARRIIAELANRTVVSDEGTISSMPIDLGKSLSA